MRMDVVLSGRAGEIMNLVQPDHTTALPRRSEILSDTANAVLKQAGIQKQFRMMRSNSTFSLLCHDADVRTTLEIPEEPYYLAQAIARERNLALLAVPDVRDTYPSPQPR